MRGHYFVLCLSLGGLGCSLSDAGSFDGGGSTDTGTLRRDVGVSDVFHRAEGGLLDGRAPPDSTLDSLPGADGPLPGVDAAGDAGPDAARDAARDAADAAADAPDYGDAMIVTSQVAYYGWEDNVPPGTDIAYPSGSYPTVHGAAGGVGSYADPITMGTSSSEIAIGTFVYVPYIQKYVVMEDDSPAADKAWGGPKMTWEIVVWMNSNGKEMPPALKSCETKWARMATTIVIDPPAGLATDTTPLFDPSTNACLP